MNYIKDILHSKVHNYNIWKFYRHSISEIYKEKFVKLPGTINWDRVDSTAINSRMKCYPLIKY